MSKEFRFFLFNNNRDVNDYDDYRPLILTKGDSQPDFDDISEKEVIDIVALEREKKLKLKQKYKK